MRSVAIAVFALALAACHEEPTIVIKFEPNDLAAAAARRDGGGAVKGGDAGAKPAPVDGGAKAAAAPAKNDAKETACKADHDCVAIPADCCGCSAGGTQVAVAKADKAKVMAARAKKCGTTTACVAMMSNDASCVKKAACDKARCVLK